MKLIRLDAPFTMMPCVASDSRRNHHRRVLRPNSVENPSSIALVVFRGSTTKPLRLAHHMGVPYVLDTCPTGPRLRQRHGPSTTSSRECVSQRLATTTSHPATLVPRSSLSARSSRSIGTSLHDLHLHHRPPYLCSTPAHHKPTDMVAQHILSRPGQSMTRSETLPGDNHLSST
jgi:hypothetical protein